MKKSNVFFLFHLVCVVLFFTNCSGSDELLNVLTVNRSVDDIQSQPAQGYRSNANSSYHVTIEDASKFASAIRHKQDFTIDVYTQDCDTLLYLVNYKSGWLIVAGDKRVNPIVAESDSNTISLNSPNKNFLAWLYNYAGEISRIVRDDKELENEHTELWSKISPKRTKEIRTTRSEEDYRWAVVEDVYCDSETYSDIIPHLISTKWGQGLPWNVKLPYDNSAGNKCYTGCTAVAFAQMVYYMHYFLGKPTSLYHDISISSSSISGATTNIGFLRSGYTPVSDHWNDMAQTAYGIGNTTYVGDLMLDIGNRLGMSYSGTGSSSSLSQSVAANYDLTYTHSSYNYQTIKNDLQNSKPVNITAFTSDGSGHSWIIDGIGKKTRHFVISKHFEYTENWMYESEWFYTFDELRARYHVNSEYDYIEEDGGTSTTELLRMNWGWDGSYDNGYYSTYPSDSWAGGGYVFNNNKFINYDFR